MAATHRVTMPTGGSGASRTQSITARATTPPAAPRYHRLARHHPRRRRATAPLARVRTATGRLNKTTVPVPNCVSTWAAAIRHTVTRRGGLQVITAASSAHNRRPHHCVHGRG
eukprot:scaffold15087_cov41-Phaeocystis_antarctica.AAC.1